MSKLRLWFGCLVVLALPAQAASPRLIVAVVVDQLRYDYLERFEPHFVTNGFRRLMDQGAFMTFAHYDYAPTVTGPGHASILSGATPMLHGIVGNSWYDRATGKEVGCVEDPSVDGVSATPGKGRSSPRNFVGGTVADELRFRFGSKVVGISLKDRAAILPAGRKPAGAYWFHGRNGHFVTSTYYMERLPGWVQAFNDRKLPAAYVGRTWDRLLDEQFYPQPDDQAWEGTLDGEKKPVFPHRVAESKDGYDHLGPTPFGDELLEEFAEAAIDGERLGQGDRPDLLCVSFSSLDSVGHRFGPYSQEVQDTVLRLDRCLARFFGFLDQRLGWTNLMVVLTADHAVAPPPEQSEAEGLDAQRLDEAAFVKDLGEHLADEFGPGRYFAPAKLVGGHLFFRVATLERKRLAVEELVPVVRDFALSSGKFLACYSREQLLEGRAPGPFGERVLRGYYAARGGDVVLVPKPYYVPGTGKTGTTHGAPFAYDTHVPVLLCGPGFVPGRYAEAFSITDIAPTLCAVLRINEPAGCMGRPFTRALDLSR